MCHLLLLLQLPERGRQDVARVVAPLHLFGLPTLIEFSQGLINHYPISVKKKEFNIISVKPVSELVYLGQVHPEKPIHISDLK